MKSLLDVFNEEYPVGSKWHIKGYPYVYVIRDSTSKTVSIAADEMLSPAIWTRLQARESLVRVKE